MGNEVSLTEILKLDVVLKRLKFIWSKSFFAVVALLIGIAAGESIVEWRIISDCKYLNAFRIDNLAYSCNRKVNEQ